MEEEAIVITLALPALSLRFETVILHLILALALLLVAEFQASEPDFSAQPQLAEDPESRPDSPAVHVVRLHQSQSYILLRSPLQTPGVGRFSTESLLPYISAAFLCPLFLFYITHTHALPSKNCTYLSTLFAGLFALPYTLTKALSLIHKHPTPPSPQYQALHHGRQSLLLGRTTPLEQPPYPAEGHSEPRLF
ncbi:hypothetical protein JZ751_024039 [Albula glossodonta]|uniref:Uncharacterized protein n=1 Tax=Albula glossodonta TaxID=121402 RepID=A0A8T2NJN3_9TELE|nr:hypothetical protein JZ751_024039 [Albula glossodonta]